MVLFGLDLPAPLQGSLRQPTEPAETAAEPPSTGLVQLRLPASQFEQLVRPPPGATAAATARVAAGTTGRAKSADPKVAKECAPAQPAVLDLVPKPKDFKRAHAYFLPWPSPALEAFVVTHMLSAAAFRTPCGYAELFETCVWHVATHPLAFPEALAEPVAAAGKKARRKTYVPKAIHGSKVDHENTEKFLVEWEGYSQKSDYTWEPRENLGGYTGLVDDWVKSKSESNRRQPPASHSAESLLPSQR